VVTFIDNPVRDATARQAAPSSIVMEKFARHPVWQRGFRYGKRWDYVRSNPVLCGIGRGS
jgi:hypothetical protein